MADVPLPEVIKREVRKTLRVLLACVAVVAFAWLALTVVRAFYG